LFVFICLSVAFGFSNRPGGCTPNSIVSPHNAPTTDSGITFQHGLTSGYTPGQTVTVTLNSANNGINGFVLWAENSAGTQIGTWSPGNNQQLCLGASTSVGHTQNLGGLTSLSSSFTVPAGMTGTLTFRAMVVGQTVSNVGLNSAAAVNAVPPPTTKPPTTAQTTIPPTTAQTTKPPTTAQTTKPPTTAQTTAAKTTAAQTTAKTTAVKGTTQAVPTSQQQQPTQQPTQQQPTSQGGALPTIPNYVPTNVLAASASGLIVSVLMMLVCALLTI